MSVMMNKRNNALLQNSYKTYSSKVSLGLAGLVTAASLTATSAHAAPILSQVFLIADQTDPSNNAVPEFTVKTTSVYELFLNEWGVADSFEKVTENFDFVVKNALTYKNSAADSYINAGEDYAESFADRVNSELGTWDDMGIVTEGEIDADENTDFGDDDWLVLNGPDGGFTDLIIAEDAGLDAFKLFLCPDGANGCNKVFNGIDWQVRNDLVDTGEFSKSDTSDETNMDQAFVFRFTETVYDHIGIMEKWNPGGEKLEVDFVGTGHIAPVPVPAGLPLVLTGLGAFAWLRQRRKAQ